MTSFTPTQGQAEALQAIKSLPENHPGGGAVLVVSGYAGTGKTTLLKVLAEEYPGMFVLTPTGKAAVRVKEAAGCEAMTIHRWQYDPSKDEKTGEYKFTTRQAGELRIPVNKTLIIDEASMVQKQVWEHLYFFCQALGLNIVLIGDGFQLPPVEVDPTKKAFSVFASDFKADYKVNLTEVLRQALESPIIRISNDIRTQSDITNTLMQLELVSEKRLEEALLETFTSKGAIICHKNATRHSLNSRIRQLRGLPEDRLVSGEPLLVTRNNYKLEVFNGEVFSLHSLGKLHEAVPVLDRYKNLSMLMSFHEAGFLDIPDPAVVSPEEVFGKTGAIDLDAINKASKSVMRRAYEESSDTVPTYLHANLGYVLTCHKSQGSEWGETVVLAEDSIRLGTVEGRRWFYTALTRARKRVRVCWL